MAKRIEKSLANIEKTNLELFQKMCSRRRQSAQIELSRTRWRELMFAAARSIKLLQLVLVVFFLQIPIKAAPMTPAESPS
jgi:hypothetical protein